jgi:hypothetical protein
MKTATLETSDTKDTTLTVRISGKTRLVLENQSGGVPSKLAADYIEEGVRRRLFPAIQHKVGAGGRVAYLVSTRWAVWLIADLVKDLGGDVAKAAERVRRPAALVQMALDYARAYPQEIEACRQFAAALEQEAA